MTGEWFGKRGTMSILMDIQCDLNALPRKDIRSIYPQIEMIWRVFHFNRLDTIKEPITKLTIVSQLKKRGVFFGLLDAQLHETIPEGRVY